jgi:hypothetical protein
MLGFLYCRASDNMIELSSPLCILELPLGITLCILLDSRNHIADLFLTIVT